jgi:endonuclease G
MVPQSGTIDTAKVSLPPSALAEERSFNLNGLDDSYGHQAGRQPRILNVGYVWHLYRWLAGKASRQLLKLSFVFLLFFNPLAHNTMCATLKRFNSTKLYSNCFTYMKTQSNSTLDTPRRSGRLLALGLSLLLALPTAQAGFLRRVVTIAAIGTAAHAYAAHKRNDHAGQPSSSGPAANGPASCASQLPLGKAPTFANPKLGSDLHTICYQEYAVAVSGKTLTPLWSAEYLTQQRIMAARSVKRANTFHEETSLPLTSRAHLNDYVRSGQDRGHMSPSGDMSNPSSQNESFSLANMIPQDPNNNRHLWEGIESGTRNFAIKNGKVYVITGPLFVGSTIRFLNNRVAIPTQIFKLLYDPVNNTGGVYVVDNTDTQRIGWKSISDFEQSSGYRFNLGSPALMGMPPPKQHS